MKTSIVAIVVLLAFSVVSASHKKHKTSAMKNSEASDSNGEWPQPEVIRNFEVPPEFTETPALIDGYDESTTASSGKHHGKSNHKSRSN